MLSWTKPLSSVFFFPSFFFFFLLVLLFFTFYSERSPSASQTDWSSRMECHTVQLKSSISKQVAKRDFCLHWLFVHFHFLIISIDLKPGMWCHLQLVEPVYRPQQILRWEEALDEPYWMFVFFLIMFLMNILFLFFFLSYSFSYCWIWVG